MRCHLYIWVPVLFTSFVLLLTIFVPRFRQQRLQFRPPFEEIKAKYFREMKKFIGIPNHFKGVSEGVETPIFPAIIIRNAEGFVACYKKAAGLFARLSAVLDKFSVSFLLSQQVGEC